MKKIILSVVVVACFLSQTNAQIKFGIKGGVTFDNFNYKDAKEELKIGNSTGWQAGALLKVKVPVIGIGIQPELLYTVRKAQVTDGGGKDATNTINYLEVPVNLQWGPDLVLLQPYLMFGPYFSYAFNIKGEELKDKLNKSDWGVSLGAGLDVWKLQVAARYSWGLQDVGVKDFKLKTNSFKVSLGILF